MIVFPIITIITPNWNTKSQIIEFLETLKIQNYPLKRIEILIIDNGSSDDSRDSIANWFSNNKNFFNTKLVTLQKNFGIANAYNLGYKNTSEQSEIIIRTESDVELEVDCLIKLVDTLIQDRSIGLVGARGVLFSNKNLIDHAARFMNWRTGTLKGLDPDELIECDCVFGPTFGVRKDLISGIGYFFKQDRFLASELELCTRVKNFGKKVVCQPKAVSFHKVGRTTRKLDSKKFSFIEYRESTLFHLEFNKYLNKITSVSIIFITSLRQLLKLNRYALLGFLSALVSFVTNKNVLLPTSDMNTLSEWLME